MNKPVRTRIAPSPTGPLHIGLARTALFNYLFARKHNGTFVLRIEDTDKERSREEYETEIREGFAWLGLTEDESYRQSELLPQHCAALETLIAQDRAYVSHEEAKDGSGREVEVVRLRNQGERVTFNDIIRGEISFDTSELGDFVIARSMQDPLYHLAVVVDDAHMNITHVIRGEDHISNTPRQMLIQRALELPQVEYAHIPLILAPDRTKLSKRRHATSIGEYHKQGYLPEAMVNYLALLGWNPGTEEEVMSLEHIIELFDLERVQKGGAVFDETRLRWFNRMHLLALPEEAFITQATVLMETVWGPKTPPHSVCASIARIARERIEIWSDLQTSIEEGEYDYFLAPPELIVSDIPWKDTNPATAASMLQTVHDMLHEAPEQVFEAPESLRSVLWEFAEREGRGAVLWPLRYALTGKKRSPDPFAVASILGKPQTLTRLKTAIALLQ